jgi:hypothetical protein
MNNKVIQKIFILGGVMLLAIFCASIKYLLIQLDFEPIQFSAILGSMITSTVFLLGFMLNGVLSDYKEAEKIPDEVAVSIEAIFDQCFTTYKRTKNKYCLEYIQTLFDFIKTLKKWFNKKVHTREVMIKLNGFNEHILKIETLTQVQYIARIKQENSNLRRLMLRAYSIREREFLASAHSVILLTAVFVISNLILTKYANTFEAMLYVFGFSSIFIFLMKLIYDLDNPFDYYSATSKFRDAVSLQSLDDLYKRIQTEVKFLKK